MALEQGNNTAGNVNHANHLYFLSGAWIIVLVVLTNAYKGENITDLTAPVSPIKPELYDDLLRLNFSIYCRSTDMFFNRITRWFNEEVDDSPFNKGKGFSDNELSVSLRFAEDNNIVKKYRKINNLTRPLTLDEIDEEIEEGFGMYVKRLQYCNKTAFVSWKGDISETQTMLKYELQNKRNFSESQVKRVISVGKEYILPTRKGWALNEVELPIKPILFRITAMVESGIAKQWKDLEAWRRLNTLTKDFRRFLDGGPTKLNLGDNIVVVFYAQAIVVSVTSLAFAVEILVHLFTTRYNQTFVIRMAAVKPTKRH